MHQPLALQYLKYYLLHISESLYNDSRMASRPCQPGLGCPGKFTGSLKSNSKVRRVKKRHFCRYGREVGTGRFKHVYKGFDLKQGIDIAWSRILQDANGLSQEQMTAIVGELEKGIDLDHPNIIKCYRAWHDRNAQCINFITEFFTSGNLRDFRQKHKHLEVRSDGPPSLSSLRGCIAQ